MDKKSYDNGSDFSFVEQKVREVQTTIENAVKTSNYQELNQSITRMVNSTLKQYQKEHPEKAGYRKRGRLHTKGRKGKDHRHRRRKDHGERDLREI